MLNTPTTSTSPAADVSGALQGLRSSGMGSKTQRMSLGAVRTVQRTVRTAALLLSVFLNVKSRDGENRK